jgi:hypothetical protein
MKESGNTPVCRIYPPISGQAGFPLSVGVYSLNWHNKTGIAGTNRTVFSKRNLFHKKIKKI